MSDHEELAAQRDAEAAELEHEGERVAESAEQARKALQDVKDDNVLPTPLEDEQD